MGPLAIISAITTAIDVVEGIGSLISGDSSQNSDTGFAGLIKDITGGDAQAAETTAAASLDVTPQSSITGVIPQGTAALLTPAASGDEALSTQTNADLNNILSADSTNPEDVPLADALTETDDASAPASTDDKDKKVDILGITKLDDPFGIKAAIANGSPIATTSITPADSGANPVAVGTDLLTDSTVSGTTSTATKIDTGIINQTSNNNVAAISDDAKEVNKSKLLKLADKVDGDAVKDLQENTLGTLSDKTSAVKDLSNPQTAQTLADKIQDKNANSLLNNPSTAGMLAHDLSPKSIGEAVRAIRTKDGLADDLSTIDTYKVVSVSKKDNVIDLRLEPSQLGKVQIKLDFTDGKANIAVIADRQETLSLLQKDTKAIEKILTDNGISADSSSLSFDLRGQQQQQQNNEGFNFFSGKPLSFRVEEQIAGMQAANDDLNRNGYDSYGNAVNGMLNIIV